MKKDKYEELKPEAFKYQEEDFTPGLFFAAVGVIIAMIIVIVLFSMIVASGVMAISK